LVAFLVGSFLIFKGIEIWSNLIAILALIAADAIVLGGVCLVQSTACSFMQLGIYLLVSFTGKYTINYVVHLGLFPLAFWIVISFYCHILLLLDHMLKFNLIYSSILLLLDIALHKIN
jgi:hypothetical protein